ncbi:PXMP2/4 family protein 2 [Gryllus bimaculatus]|nr:PXMP2/4 family protein 2 [Gryllus bimaculatus]
MEIQHEKYMLREKMELLKWLKQNYIIYNCLQAGAVMGTGDFIAQKFVEKKDVLDTRRLATFAGLGTFFVGPIQSTWFRFLNSKVPFHWPPVQRGLVKMVVDQATMAPTMVATVMSLLELRLGSGTLSGVKEELQNKYPTIMGNGYKVWPAVQALNFTFTPVQYQVLVTQLVGVAWNAYFSTAKNRHGLNYDQRKQGT